MSPYDALLPWIKTTDSGGFFITGTDTDSGKTFVSCQIAAFLAQKLPDLVIFGRKPIASGALKQSDGSLLSTDAKQLQIACGHFESLQTICPYVFEPPISPARAIQKAQADIGLQELIKACDAPGFRLVEGAGGFYSPLSPDALNADLAKALDLPIVLVVGNRLGCINQALLSIEAIQKHGLQIALVVVNDLGGDADIENVTDLQTLLKPQGLQCVHQTFKTDIWG